MPRTPTLHNVSCTYSPQCLVHLLSTSHVPRTPAPHNTRASYTCSTQHTCPVHLLLTTHVRASYTCSSQHTCFVHLLLTTHVPRTPAPHNTRTSIIHLVSSSLHYMEGPVQMCFIWIIFLSSFFFLSLKAYSMHGLSHAKRFIWMHKHRMKLFQVELARKKKCNRASLGWKVPCVIRFPSVAVPSRRHHKN